MTEADDTKVIASPLPEELRPSNGMDIVDSADETGLVPERPTTLMGHLPVGRVLQQTADYIEPITRFDQRDLHPIAPEEETRLITLVSCTQRVSINTNIRSHPGFAHQSAIKLPRQHDVGTMIQRTCEEAVAHLPARVSAWAALDTSEYRRLLPRQPFLTGFTDRYAYEYKCGPCTGNGKVTCMTCGGSCRTRCTPCEGGGRIQCSSCSGLGRTRCNSCNGQGSGYRWEHVMEWDHAKNMNVTVHKQVHHTCFCNMGYNTCNFCQSGTKQCPGCNGLGIKDCSSCLASGKTSCDACAATGTQHTLGYLESNVSTTEKLELHHDEPAVVALMTPRLTIPELTKSTRLISARHTPDGARIDSYYSTDLAVTKASMSAAGMAFTIFGFGEQAEILDYQNIAGKLLQTDVDALDNAVKGASAWRIRGGDNVLQAASAFVESELNLLIAESVAETKSSDASSAPSSIESQFKGLVDQAYVIRATDVFKEALGRIYQPHMVEPGLYCIGIAVLVSAASYGFSWPDRSWALLLGVATGIAVWAAVEFNNRRRIGKLFPGTMGARMLAQVDATGLPARLRWFAFGAALGGSLLAMWCVNLLPHERSRQAEEISTKYLRSTLQDWYSSSQADLSLRAYPALAPLRKSVTAGDAGTGGVVLGWQLVLGAGGVPKEVAEATRLFNAAAEKKPHDPLIRTGQVVALLNSDATPQALRDGLESLRQAETSGLVEARYWRARLQLAEQSPVHDLRAGLQAMTEAADMGHASAAFEMSRRFASGNGVRVDNRRSTSYLQRAANAGLPQAKAQLAR